MTFCHISSCRKIREISSIFYRKPRRLPWAHRLHQASTLFAQIDLTSNTLTLAGSLQWRKSFIRAYLGALVKKLEPRNVHVSTRVYETVLSAPWQVPLMEVFNATPNSAFWPPSLAAHHWDVDRWSALARATGRHSMKWEVKNDEMECEWIRQES